MNLANHTFTTQVIQSLQEGVVVVDLEGRCRLWNESLAHLTGIGEIDALARLDTTELPLVGNPEVQGAFKVAFQGGMPQPLIVRWEHPHSGQAGWASCRVSPIRDHEGALAGALASMTDFSAQMAAEERLRKISLAVEQSPVMIFMTDLEGRIEYVNPRFTAVTGFTAEEIQGENPKFLKSGEQPASFYADLWATIREGVAWEGELLNRRKNGETFWERCSISPVRDGAGKVASYVAIGEDITALKKAEDERKAMVRSLHQSQKLESLGSLAGGVAHDLNNVLGAILGIASSHRERFATGEGDPVAFAKGLDTVIQACLRGRTVVKSLLYFAHKGMGESAPVDLNQLIRELVDLLAHTTLQRVELETSLEEPLGWIAGDPVALSHALMNLCVNSVDAMPSGGTVTIHTRRLPDHFLEVVVKDNGTGMPQEVIEKAVEPFFTTKPAGKGTGLGLAIVFGTVKAHQGEMQIRSQPGLGTEITMRFPRLPVRVRPVAEEDGGHGVVCEPLEVLIVDDDPLILDALLSVLADMGHKARAANRGQEGLEILDEGYDPDLVILDMNMPGMNGAVTLEHILARRPKQKVLISTGYSEVDVKDLLAKGAQVGSILKPFTRKELTARMAAMFPA